MRFNPETGLHEVYVHGQWEYQQGPIDASVGQAKTAGLYGYTNIDHGWGDGRLTATNAQGQRVTSDRNGKFPEQVEDERAATARNAPRQISGLLNAVTDQNGYVVSGVNDKTGEQVTLQNGKLVGDGRPNVARLQGALNGAAQPAGPPAAGNGTAPTATSAPAAPTPYTYPAVFPAQPAAAPAPAAPTSLPRPSGPAPGSLEAAMTPSANPGARRPLDISQTAQVAAAAAAPAIQPPTPAQGGYGTTSLNVPRPAATIPVAPGSSLSVANGQTVQGGTQGAVVTPVAPQYGGGVAIGQQMDEDAPSYTGGAAGRFIGSDEAARNARLGGTAGSLPAPGAVGASVPAPSSHYSDDMTTLRQMYPDIGVAGSDTNKRFVAAFNAGGQNKGNLLDLAQRTLGTPGQFAPGSMTPAQASHATRPFPSPVGAVPAPSGGTQFGQAIHDAAASVPEVAGNAISGTVNTVRDAGLGLLGQDPVTTGPGPRDGTGSMSNLGSNLVDGVTAPFKYVAGLFGGGDSAPASNVPRPAGQPAMPPAAATPPLLGSNVPAPTVPAPSQPAETDEQKKARETQEFWNRS